MSKESVITPLGGKITQSIGGLYHVSTPQGSYACRAKGLFRKDKLEPITGDLVEIEITHEGDREGFITQLHPRKNQLIRPKVANVDQAVLAFSITNPPINPDLLDRLIMLAEEQSLRVLIVLTKCDLATDPEIVALYRSVGYTVIETSATTGQGMAELHTHMNQPDVVSVFCGTSGVGKSSLTNFFYQDSEQVEQSVGRPLQAVGNISEKGKRGKHTTRSSKLIPLDQGYLVDSPGFSNVSFRFDKSQLAYYFIEFAPYLGQCRFGDCSHINEPDCAVKAQVGETITDTRYERYKQFYQELS